ncbi:TetR/AcrR family transcriptional regulator [Paenibacillus silviterrae]|uniref:TetR/AcrR family transcriptional regulator n=1 Tax=Paenibacillus silviterrae TaxID=3242194 RepID=UPI0025436D22|nr:TetR/AcrR family transcriptional regulator [Paenibacillus chinjuensis]
MKKNPTRLSNKDTVLQTAASLFLTRGYQLTSMDDIVAVSNVSKTNIYYHYKNKEELLLAIVDQLIDGYDRQISLVLSQDELSIPDRLDRMLRLFADRQEQQDILGGCPFLTLYTQTAHTSEDAAAKIKAFFDRQLAGVERLLELGKQRGELPSNVPTAATAALIVTSVEGALFVAKACGRPQVLEDLRLGLASMLMLER